MLKIIERLLPKGQFSRAVGLLAGGTAGAQVLMVVAAPLLTRLYSPEDFGLLAVYSALLALFSVNSSLRYQLAIPLPDNDEDASHIVALSLICVALVTFLCTVLALFSSNETAALLKAPLLTSYLWLLPIGVGAVGTYQVFNYWALRKKNYAAVAVTRIKQAVVTLIIQLIGCKFGAIALVAGQAGGQGVGSYSLAKQALGQLKFRRLRWKGILDAAKRYRNFPYYSTWDAFFNTAGVHLPPLLFATLFSPSAAGLYALAHRVLAVPMSVIGDAVGKVFFSNAPEALRQGKLETMVMDVHSKLVIIAMPPVFILFVAGPELFAFVFGDRWQQAGEFARWMAPWLYLVFVTGPLTTLFAVLEKQLHGLWFQAALIFLRLAAVSIGAFYENLILTVILFSLASSFCWAALLLWVGINTGNAPIKILRTSIKAGLGSCVCVLPLWLSLHFMFLNDWWLCFLILSIVMMLLFYKKNLLAVLQ